MYECKKYIASIHIPASPEELPEGMFVADEPEMVSDETFIMRRRTLSLDTILNQRDPFSDVTLRQDAERQRAKDLEEFWSQRYYSILKDKQGEKKEDVISFAYIIKERPSLPPPVLDEIEIEGTPKESIIVPVKQESPFKWKGMLIAKG